MPTIIKRFKGLRLIIAEYETNQYVIAIGAGKKNITFNIKWYTKRQLKRIAARKWERVVDVVTRRSVYFYQSGTDCDGVSSGNGIKYKNIFAAEREQESDYEWADGPLYFSRITKAEYEKSESHYRDYGMEAHEDGHSHVRYHG